MSKGGVSPVIATVLLIAIVLVLALIVFMWFRGMTRETVTKFGEENIELACDDVGFEASYSNGEVFILNMGNVPIYEMRIKLLKVAGHETKSLKEISTAWPEIGLKQGGTFSGDISNIITSEVKEIILIPVLVGKAGKEQRTFVCDEQYGYNILI